MMDSTRRRAVVDGRGRRRTEKQASKEKRPVRVRVLLGYISGEEQPDQTEESTEERGVSLHVLPVKCSPLIRI